MAPGIVARWWPDLHCRYINQAVARKTGRLVEWFLGKTNAEAGQPAHICKIWDDALRQVFATGDGVAVASGFPAPGGRTRYHESTLAPEFAADVPSENRAHCLEAGMDGFLTRPVRKEQLREALTEWLQRPEPSPV